jgi:hypothetical protein
MIAICKEAAASEPSGLQLTKSGRKRLFLTAINQERPQAGPSDIADWRL